MNEALSSALRKLRLSGLAQTLEVRLQEAVSHSLSHAEFLELILQDELSVRQERLIDRRVKAAGFRELKPLADFEWSFNPSIKKKQVYDLACCRFIRERRDVLWMGPPGVGKSFLVQALAYEAIKQGFVVLYRSIFDVVRDFLHDEAFGGEERVLAKYLKPDLLIVDDMGMKQLPKRSGEYHREEADPQCMANCGCRWAGSNGGISVGEDDRLGCHPFAQKSGCRVANDPFASPKPLTASHLELSCLWGYCISPPNLERRTNG